MSILLLINEQEVKDITGMSENIDASKFRHQIQVCQDIYIKAAIGETCYDELLDSVENEDPTALETTLLDGDNRSFPGLKSANENNKRSSPIRVFQFCIEVRQSEFGCTKNGYDVLFLLFIVMQLF